MKKKKKHSKLVKELEYIVEAQYHIKRVFRRAHQVISLLSFSLHLLFILLLLK